METARTDLVASLATLGLLLQQRGQTFDVVLVGGGCLLLREVVSRPTKDLDILGERLPDGSVRSLETLPVELTKAATDVADALELAPDWINVGPRSLNDLGLPPGFGSRLTLVEYGSLRVWLAGIDDLVFFKLYAATDSWPRRDRHLEDLEALAPNRDQLLAAAAWARSHDPSPGFRQLLVELLTAMGVEEADRAVV